MFRFIKYFRRDFWKLTLCLIILNPFYFSLKILYGNPYTVMRFIFPLLISLFCVFCVKVFFQNKNGTFFNLIERYWGYLFVVLIIFYFDGYLLGHFHKLLDIDDVLSIYLSRLYRLLDVAIIFLPFVLSFVFLISMAKNIDYIKGIKITLESFQVLFLKILFWLFCISSLLAFEIVSDLHTTFLYGLINGILMIAIPAYYILSVVSEEKQINSEEKGKTISDNNYKTRFSTRFCSIGMGSIFSFFVLIYSREGGHPMMIIIGSIIAIAYLFSTIIMAALLGLMESILKPKKICIEAFVSL